MATRPPGPRRPPPAPRSIVARRRWGPEEAAEALAYFRKLYHVQRELAGRFAGDDDAGRQRYRSAQAAVWDEFHSWLLRKREQILPKSPLGDAIGYKLSNWAALMRYTERRIWRSTITRPSGRCGNRP